MHAGSPITPVLSALLPGPDFTNDFGMVRRQPKAGMNSFTTFCKI